METLRPELKIIKIMEILRLLLGAKYFMRFNSWRPHVSLMRRVPAVIASADKGGTQSSADGKGWSWGSTLGRLAPLFPLAPLRWLPFLWCLMNTLCFLTVTFCLA